MTASKISCALDGDGALNVLYLSTFDGDLSRDEGIPYLVTQDDPMADWSEQGAILSAPLDSVALVPGVGDDLCAVGLRRADRRLCVLHRDRLGAWRPLPLGALGRGRYGEVAVAQGPADTLDFVLLSAYGGVPVVARQTSTGRVIWMRKVSDAVPLSSLTSALMPSGDLLVVGLGQDDARPYAFSRAAADDEWSAMTPIPSAVPLTALALVAGVGDTPFVVGLGADDHLPSLMSQGEAGGWTWNGVLPGAVPLSALTATRGATDEALVFGVGRNDKRAYVAREDRTLGAWRWEGRMPDTGVALRPVVAACRAADGAARLATLERRDIGPRVYREVLPGGWDVDELSRQLGCRLRRLLEYYFNPDDEDGDGVAEIERARLLEIEPALTMYPPGRRLILVLVESRLLADLPGARYDLAALKARLATYRADLKAEAYDPVLIELTPHAGPPQQDGKTLLAVRHLLQRVAAAYPQFVGAVLIGSFPEARLTRLWPETGTGTLNGASTRCYREGGFIFAGPRFDTVLADLTGNWQDLYRESAKLDRHTFFVDAHATEVVHGDVARLTDAVPVLNESGQPPAPGTVYDTFLMQDAQYSASTNTHGRADVDFHLAATDPEACPIDRCQPNPIALPDVCVSRINARLIAVQPPSNAHALDPNGDPQPADRGFSEAEWERDPDLERTLLVEYFDRNHAYRKGLYAGQGHDIRIVESGLGLFSAHQTLQGWNHPTVDTLNASLLDFVRWLRQPATLRLIAAHADCQSTRLRAAPDEQAQLDAECGPKVWRWIDVNHQVVPTLSGHSNADLCLYRTLWANGVLNGVVPSVTVHLGCDVNGLSNPARPYDDPRYGTFQNAESLLFYANQVAVLCHIAWWNQGPSGFGAAIADDGSATVGDCWRRFNRDWSQRADLRLNQADRKRSYEWSIVGDWTLCPA